MKITSKGQLTIPTEIREQLGLLPDTEVQIEVEGNTLRIRRAAPMPNRERTEPLEREPFVGSWRDRGDLADSSEWVRRTRAREWPSG